MSVNGLAVWAYRYSIALSAPLLLGATNPVSDFGARILAVHNRERATVDVPPLRWDSALVQSAKSWADHLAATGAFEHAPELAASPQGENLWAGTKGRYSVEAMVDGWIREKRNFKPGIFPDNSVTGKVADVGHYTQLMWRESRGVGCAEASNARDDILVCRYADAGNYLGEKPF